VFLEDQFVKFDENKYSFDYLVLAVGAKTNFFSFIDGLRENSYGVKDLHRAYNFRKEFETLIFQKLQNEQGCNSGDLNIAIGGAGLSGVEVAAEMAYVIKTYSKTIGKNAKDIKIHLIDASDTILPGSSEYIIKNTHKRLQDLGVNILTNSFISRVDSEYIYFKGEEKIKYCFMIFTGGIKASDLNESIECEKNKINQFIVNSTLNIADKENIFAIGDCVEIKDKEGNLLPPTAQSAERSAEYVANVIRKRIDGESAEGFDASMAGMFVALGGRYAVGEVFKHIKVQGYSAYLLKKAITYVYHLGLRLRINTGFKNRINNN
jgi:NADH dehydrogenase